MNYTFSVLECSIKIITFNTGANVSFCIENKLISFEQILAKVIVNRLVIMLAL